MVRLSTYLSIITTHLVLSVQSSHDDPLIYPSSCRDLEDGTYQLKLMSGDLVDSPIVTLQCSNGYTILDVSQDSNLEHYFNSYMKFHHSVAGPTNDYKVNWEGWYKPDDSNTNYIISPDCTTCSESHYRQIYEKKTAYMMTGTLFGCFWNFKGDHNYDEDYDSYECYASSEAGGSGDTFRNALTDESSADDWDKSGVCAFSVRSSEHTLPSPMTHDACTGDLTEVTTEDGDAVYTIEDTYHLKPSLGTDGEFCVCVQPSATEYYPVTREEYDDWSVKREKESEKESGNGNNAQLTFQQVKKTYYNEKEGVYELYATDFIDGTYRIETPGTYRVMEDIEFNFNFDYSNPNSDWAWWPTEDQSDIYPGAGGYYDSYFLGFYAGVTIECNDVVLDLNGKTLKMSEVFYHQQRWFTTVSLTGQYFLPGQGIGFFGADPQFAENVLIKDGVLGLTSHHGIHGHFNKNIVIDNVWVKDFETHGIQFNGFDTVTITNCEIGPSSEVSYFKGEYGHARTLLRRFKGAALDHPDTQLKFYNRDEAVTMSDIVDELEKQVDMAYNYVVNKVQYDENDESWQSAKSLFIDKSNLPNGAAMYGIFLNTYGASVLTYNLDTYFYSNNAMVSNTKIHGLKHSMTEYVRIHYPSSGNLFMNPLHAPFDAYQILGDLTNLDNPRYYGSILTDACIALEKLESNNWNYLQAQLSIADNMLDWAFGKEDSLSNMDNIVIGCNSDVMIHSGKGINGLRIDGVNNVEINNIEIYDISEQTPLGNTICGDYDYFDGRTKGYGGGHFRQTLPMQSGFSGTMLQGININAANNIRIKDVRLENLESYHGPVFGISIWPATEVTFEGNIMTTLFNAGNNIADGVFSYEDRPNIAPEVCAIRMYESYTDSKDGTEYVATVNEENVEQYDVSCMKGHVSCLGTDDTFTHFGEYNNDDVKSKCNWEDKTSVSLISSQNEHNAVSIGYSGDKISSNDLTPSSRSHGKHGGSIIDTLFDNDAARGTHILLYIFVGILASMVFLCIVARVKGCCCWRLCNGTDSDAKDDAAAREQLIDHKNSEYGSVCLGY